MDMILLRLREPFDKIIFFCYIYTIVSNIAE